MVNYQRVMYGLYRGIPCQPPPLDERPGHVLNSLQLPHLAEEPRGGGPSTASCSEKGWGSLGVFAPWIFKTQNLVGYIYIIYVCIYIYYIYMYIYIGWQLKNLASLPECFPTL